MCSPAGLWTRPGPRTSSLPLTPSPFLSLAPATLGRGNWSTGENVRGLRLCVLSACGIGTERGAHGACTNWTVLEGGRAAKNGSGPENDTPGFQHWSKREPTGPKIASGKAEDKNAPTPKARRTGQPTWPRSRDAVGNGLWDANRDRCEIEKHLLLGGARDMARDSRGRRTWAIARRARDSAVAGQRLARPLRDPGW